MFIKNFTYSNKSQSAIKKYIKNLSKIQSELNINYTKKLLMMDQSQRIIKTQSGAAVVIISMIFFLE